MRAKKITKEPLQLLHSYKHSLVIGRLECHKNKSNEIPTSKELLALLKLKNTIFTAYVLDVLKVSYSKNS